MLSPSNALGLAWYKPTNICSKLMPSGFISRAILAKLSPRCVVYSLPEISVAAASLSLPLSDGIDLTRLFDFLVPDGACIGASFDIEFA